ncbi:Y-family DNA polymerase [Clostridium rectalis]|uniref:Y-family DNA polymerase n=1 Tax=Clostridium rectalis TaxID=2040295 RepID=UPI000F63AE9D|nr:DNA polymerase IV [Clostridium rectalis]
MKNNSKRLIFHIDVNSAYLSWEAAYRLQHGELTDLRKIPSVVGGNEKLRHGIVLTKSIPAKKFDIKTGEPLYSAKNKCTNLIIVPPKYDLYIKCSNAMHKLFENYTPIVQRFSIDESWLDFTDMKNHYPNYIKLAYEIKDKIKNNLGFTVSIGISSNKLLAKVASDMKKPDAITTLFPHEIESKMWKLPVENLFGVGKATLLKLHKLNIFSIGDLANYDVEILKNHLKSHGVMLWNYANGIDNSEVKKNNHINIKSMGNSTTIPFDVTDKQTAHIILLSLCERVASRLRQSNNCCRVISVNIKENDFNFYSHQQKLYIATDSTQKIAEVTYKLFDEYWQGNPIRHLGIHVADLYSNDFCQYSLFENKSIEKQKSIDSTIDKIRQKYGATAIKRSCFINSGIYHMSGGVGDFDYPIMNSKL